MSPQTASTEGAWQTLLTKGSEVFRLERRLPDIVHRLRCGPRPFFDGDLVFGTSAWTMVASLAALHRDPLVHFLTIEPSAEHFLEAAGTYGGFTVAVTSDGDGYARGLFGGTLEAAPGKPAYVAEVAVLVGETGRWGIWVERGVAGVVSVEDPSALGGWELAYGPFLSAEDALDDFLALNLADGDVADAFARRLKRNYSAFADDG